MGRAADIAEAQDTRTHGGRVANIAKGRMWKIGKSRIIINM